MIFVDKATGPFQLDAYSEYIQSGKLSQPGVDMVDAVQCPTVTARDNELANQPGASTIACCHTRSMENRAFDRVCICPKCNVAGRSLCATLFFQR